MMRRRKRPNDEREGAEEMERADLDQGLAETQRAIAQAYAGFNISSDPELVESYVYEIQALRSRYSYLLRRRKALEGQQIPAAETALPAL